MPASAIEQYILELVNRARLDPAAEAARDGIDLNEGLAAGTITTASKQPLAMNETLLTISRAHDLDMLANDYFDHTDSAGQTPFQRMTTAGYNYTWAGENIAWNATTGTLTQQMSIDLETQLFVDAGIAGRGHRINLLNGNFREIGDGVANGPFQGYNATFITQDFGSAINGPFLTGVSYVDSDHDNFYSIGEGRNGVAISVAGGGTTSTAGAGGYSLAIASGPQTISFSGGGLVSPVTVSVTIQAGTNAKVDMVDKGTVTTSASIVDIGGATRIIGLGLNGLSLTGNGSNETFSGTKGNDTFTGGGGTDEVDFFGPRSAYAITNLAAGNVQVSGPEGIDTLIGISRLKFTDQIVNLVQGPYTVSYFLANKSSLDAAGIFSLADTAANVSSAFDSIAQDSQVKAVTFTDAGIPALALTSAQRSSDASAIAEITNAIFLASLGYYYVGHNGASSASVVLSASNANVNLWENSRMDLMGNSNDISAGADSNLGVTGAGNTLFAGPRDGVWIGGNGASGAADVVNGSNAVVYASSDSNVQVPGANNILLAGADCNLGVIGSADTVNASAGDGVWIGGNGASGTADVVNGSNAVVYASSDSNVQVLGSGCVILSGAGCNLGVTGSADTVNVSAADGVWIGGNGASGAANVVNGSNAVVYASSETLNRNSRLRGWRFGDGGARTRIGDPLPGVSARASRRRPTGIYASFRLPSALRFRRGVGADRGPLPASGADGKAESLGDAAAA